MNKKNSIYAISTMGLLVAMMIVLTNFLSIQTQFLRISFEFIPQAILGMFFGPLWAGISSVVADVVGTTLFGKARFFICFTLNALISGVLYGLFFYKKEITLKNTFICVLLNTIIISLFLTPLWLSIMYHVPFFNMGLWIPRIIKAVAMLFIQTGSIMFFGKALPLKMLASRYMAKG
ncbi:folate ECF transporter [Companilactobacillus bobalius]|nr:folate family ECF transporter S component [Companilactobacillus bobalius]KAE9560586.1 folate ECF transporter [Companilactobacillus bobalius]